MSMNDFDSPVPPEETAINSFDDLLLCFFPGFSRMCHIDLKYRLIVIRTERSLTLGAFRTVSDVEWIPTGRTLRHMRSWFWI